MLLKFCNDSFLFTFTNTKFFNILCCFIILFLIILICLTFDDKFLKKIRKKKIFIVISSGTFVGFWIFLFLLVLNTSVFEGCVSKYNMNLYLTAESNLNKLSGRIDNSEVIVVGDSRMAFIEDDDEIVLPSNMEIVALSGASINWFEETGLKQTKKIIDKDDYDVYHVVVNMGVNDIQYTPQYLDRANKYFEDYIELAKYNSKVKLYILSVNPIIEKKLNKEQPQNVRTNAKIRKFNNVFIKKLEETKQDNVFYCDSYNDLKFKTDDGLHYTQETSRDIIHYIANSCVQF